MVVEVNVSVIQIIGLFECLRFMSADALGFQYTNRVFYNKLKVLKMKQSLSRVSKCIDNCPMGGFWCVLKRERYYVNRFTCRNEFVQLIENYITYYNNRRVQRNLGVLTPLENHCSYPLAA